MEFAPPPQLQSIDVLGSLLRGQSMSNQMTLQNQQVAEGTLKLDQLKQMMRFRQAIMGGITGQPAQQQPDGYSPPQTAPQPGSGGYGAQSASGPTGGIQNGPQASVAHNPYSPTAYSIPAPYQSQLSGGTLDAVAAIDPEMSKSLDARQKAAEAERDAKVKFAQGQAQPYLATVAGGIRTPNPAIFVGRNQGLHPQ